MKKYLIKVQPLTHLHIGSGREFEPINYIIDSYKAKTTDDKTVIRYALYEFDEMDFYANLDESTKDEFLNQRLLFLGSILDTRPFCLL